MRRPTTRSRIANQVAQQIWYTLDRAIRDAYPNTSNIVLVGGDDIIPFYRVPDETVVAPESDYYQELLATDTLSGRCAARGQPDGNSIQTDDFYADRVPTAWHGRRLFVPDLALGRLVERPSEIVSYLAAYAESNYTIDASVPSAAALVTGYDIVTDEARELAPLRQLGFEPSRQPALETLINDNWSANQLTGLWLGAQATPHQLVSFNGHFSHNQLIAADGRSRLNAGQLLQQPASYPQLTDFAVGCHSGLSATDSAFEGANAAALQTDFAQAVLAQAATGSVTPASPTPTRRPSATASAGQLFTEQIGGRSAARLATRARRSASRWCGPSKPTSARSGQMASASATKRRSCRWSCMACRSCALKCCTRARRGVPEPAP